MFKETNEAGRGILKLVSVVGGVSIAIGALSVLYGLGEMRGFGSIFVGSGIATAVAGMIQIAVAQIGVAVFDQRDISLEMLRMMKGEATQGQEPVKEEASAEYVAPQAITRQIAEGVRVYKGVEIHKIGNRWFIGAQEFMTLGKAKQFIDKEPSAAKAAGANSVQLGE
ncbi:hypothetical protein AYJ57_21520 (plasmid) [Salipiger sp. CCB-MM3]|uniref:hypothetical protein n=1 Tax=Salipiger sp. CCB-MM3 TaxID=1792508 RepID=UPI00080AAB32|nr:hypothetical protein [Salipiger sp. CCB-MM3]ANT63054.1 hypothetical protein AYJ57_21520 [Salipiger sp. CCB-MM3]